MDIVPLMDSLDLRVTPGIKTADEAFLYLQTNNVPSVSYKVTRQFIIMFPLPEERHIILFTSDADLCSHFYCTVPYILKIGHVHSTNVQAFLNERHVKKTIEFLLGPNPKEKTVFTLSYVATVLQSQLYKRLLLSC